MPPQGMDRRSLVMLSLTHVCDDVNQSFLPALLPFLISQRHLSYTAATVLVLAASVSSSVVQPAIGHLADRRSLPWLIPCGVFLASLGMSLAGVMPSYWLVALVVTVSGVGVASFHPEAVRYANYVAGAKKASGMAWFTVGGNLGFALGPLFATPVLLAFGVKGTLFAALPGTIMALLIWRELPRLRTFAPPAADRRDAATATRQTAGVDQWGAFGRLTVFVVLRAIMYFGVVTFVPLYCIAVLHAGKAEGNLVLGAALLAGAVGTIYGGRLADRFGRRVVLRWSMGIVAPLLALFIAVTSHWGAVALHGWPAVFTVGCAMAIGATLVGSQAAFVVLGQEYLPTRIGTASGVTLGLAISLGGGASPALGAIADRFGTAAALEAVVALAVLALGVAFTLPSIRRATGGASASPPSSPSVESPPASRPAAATAASS